MCPCSWTKYNAAVEAQTCNPRISSQEHYHWAGNCTPYNMLNLIWSKNVLHSDERYLYDNLKNFFRINLKKDGRQQNASIINQHA